LGDNFFWLLDLPIKMPHSNWSIPVELSQFSEFIKKSIAYETLINPNIQNCYAYLSIDQRPVKPTESQRRPGWHSDSFITNNTRPDIKQTNIEMDSIYLAYNSIPTEFCTNSFTFNKTFDHHNNTDVLNHFDKIAAGKPIITYKPFTILQMGPECVHRVGYNTSNNTCQRTFIKLVFSTEIFNRLGNDHNYLLDYNWPLVPRTIERNNSNIKIFRSDDNKYIITAHHDLAEVFNHKPYPWAKKQIIQAVRNSKISAYPAIPGELLQTNLNGDIITYNTAKNGDWKVKKLSNGTEYFLSSNQISTFYDYEQNFSIDQQIIFKPKPLIISTVEISMPIKIMTPWNHSQYLSPGDFLIKRNDNDIYGIAANNFKHDYFLC